MSGPAHGLRARLLELQRRAGRGMELGLDRVDGALERLGRPEAHLAVVHVAGTNGKGSASAMVESIARAAGVGTGLYTSPHLARFSERIRIGGEPIDDTLFELSLARALEAAPEATFFEALTLAAFVAFREAGVALAVLEVGLGGRLDATNVVRTPAVTAVTSIGLDHTELLGSTLADVAREKAGILKPDCPVVLGPLDPEAEAAIVEVARRLRAGPIWRVERGPGPRGAGVVRVTERADGHVFEPPAGFEAADIEARVALEGAHQAANAAVAVGIAWQLQSLFSSMTRAIGPGLASVRWPGRLESFERCGVEVLLDCAHNLEGARALAAALRARGTAPERTALVFGALADKPWGEVLGMLSPLATRRFYATPGGRAAVPLEALASVAPGEPVGDPAHALERAVGACAPGDTVIVTGSIYLVGAARAALLALEADPVVAL